MSVYGDLMKLDEVKKPSIEKVESSLSATEQEESQLPQPNERVAVPKSPISEDTVTLQTDEVSKQVNMFTSKKTNKKVIKQANNIASNNAILQFDETDIEELREAAYKAQTYRLTDREVEWIKDAAYRLSKEVRRGKVSQVDILRIGIKLFERLLSFDKPTLLKLLEEIK